MAIDRSAADFPEPSIERLRALDADAWTALYDSHYERLWRYACARTGSPDLAEDVVAQVFAEAVASIHRFRSMGRPIVAWLYVIARNHASKAVRDARRHAPMPAELAASANGDQIESLDLSEALQRLPEAQREVVTLRYVVGATTDEIARLLGKSPAAVYSLQARAMEAIRMQLQPPPDESQRTATNPAPRRV